MAFFLPIFQLLNRANIRYIVVGGVAMVLHGYVRTTTDVDLVVDLAKGEASKVIQVLSEAGYRPRAPVSATGFSDAATRQSWSEEKNMIVFSLYHPGQPGVSIDLFVKYPIDFSLLWKKSKVFDISGTPVRTCSLDDLILLKEISGRNLDKVDIEKLREIKRHEQQ